MTHIKGILKTDKYNCTIRAIDVDDDKTSKSETHLDENSQSLRVVWTIDEDTEYAWRNLIDLYPMNEYGLARLQRTCKALNYELHEGQYQELIGLRGLLSVGVRIKGNYRTNEILEYNLPSQPAHINVNAPKDDSHYNHTTDNPRRLPI